jgi:hypothetical protein
MIGRDFERIAPEPMLPHEEEHVCATVENWPEDEFAHWVASHRDEVKTLVCGSLSYGELGVCQG